MGRGRASPTGVCLCRGKLHLPLELLCPFPGPAAARPAPRQARTNCADELLKSFLRALFPRSRSQRPPVATCQSWGLITCAGLGAAHSSPASPCEMLTSGRWAPRPPASSAEGTERGGTQSTSLVGTGSGCVARNVGNWEKEKCQGACRSSSVLPQGTLCTQSWTGH